MRTVAVRGLAVLGAVLCLLAGARPADAGAILFVGNSFTFADGSPLRFYRAGTVTDLNGSGQGGVPALFKSFADQAGLGYDVFLETQPGVGIDWHLDNRLALILSRPWDDVVLQSYSTLDKARPGDSTLLVTSVHEIAARLRARAPAVRLHLVATWPRADQIYERAGAWYGKPVDAMALDLRAGYDRAAAATPGIRDVVPVGQAWIRAMHAGLADANPYDGIEAGKIDLWGYDHYHASTHGYYLEALVLFGAITGRDPRSLGDAECSAFELGLALPQVHALQQVAYEQLLADRRLDAAPSPQHGPAAAQPCARPP